LVNSAAAPVTQIPTNPPRPAANPAGTPRRRRWLRRWFVGVLLMASALLVSAHQHVLSSGRSRCHAVGEAPLAEAIVVPGARIHPDGTPFPMLTDRLTTALVLWRHGRAQRFVVSGRGGGGIAVDEVAAMRRWLEQRGVPAAAIVDDPLGLRTVDTMQNCRALGLNRVLVVSNDFHVPRAVFLAGQVGLDAHGVAAVDGYDYSATTLASNHGREVLARVWAWFEAFVFGV
jgi:SanA protein